MIIITYVQPSFLHDNNFEYSQLLSQVHPSTVVIIQQALEHADPIFTQHMSAVYSLLPVACCLLPAVCCLLPAACCLLSGLC
jgi:hypothetical protein